MPKPLLVGLLAGGLALVIAIAVVTGVLIATGDDEGEPGQASSAATPALSPAATRTPAATATPTTGLPPEIDSLPAAIRERVRQQYLRGEITREQIQQLVQARSAAARSGIVTKIQPDRIEVRGYDGVDFSTRITPDTAIKYINRPGTVSDLKVGETVFILSRDAGETAFSIESYGTLASP